VPYVPVVDISGDPDVVGAELDEICRTAGFFQITGHGIRGKASRAGGSLTAVSFGSLVASEPVACRSGS